MLAVSRESLTNSEDQLFAEQLLREYEGKIVVHSGQHESASVRLMRTAMRRQLRLAAFEAERTRLHELRAANTINDETLRVIEAELDEREMLAATALTRG